MRSELAERTTFETNFVVETKYSEIKNDPMCGSWRAYNTQVEKRYINEPRSHTNERDLEEYESKKYLEELITTTYTN